MNWKHLLESASESVNDDLRLRNKYLTAENRILCHQIDGRVQLTDSERKELAEIGAKLGKKALAEIATVAQPDTILAWNQKFANQKADASERPKSVGRLRVDKEIEDWVVRMAHENRSWGYDRIQGTLKHLGDTISDQTVGNILKRHGISPAPERIKTVSWREFTRSHLDILLAADFFNSEVWSWFGQSISSLLSFIHFSRHQAQSVMTTLSHQMQAPQALTRRVLDLGIRLRRCAYLVTEPSRARQVGNVVLDQTRSQFEFADARQTQSQAMGKVVFWFDASAKSIRDGPRRRQHPLGDLLTDHDRKAA